MDNIYYDGNLKASITVGNVSGGTVNAYTKAEVNELLEGKADNKHVHSYDDLTEKPNIPSIDGLASEEYVNNQINNIPKVDLSDYVTNEQLMEDLNSKAEKEHIHTEYLTHIPSEYITESELLAKDYAKAITVNSIEISVTNLKNRVTSVENNLENKVSSEDIREIKIVDQLPEVEEEGILYLVRKSGE